MYIIYKWNKGDGDITPPAIESHLELPRQIFLEPHTIHNINSDNIIINL